MRWRDRDILFRSTLSASLTIVLAMLTVMLMGVWGAHHDLVDLRRTYIGAELNALRSHGERTVARLEREWKRREPPSDERTVESALEHAPWLLSCWKQLLSAEDGRFAAIVDGDGRVVMHSNERRQGERLGDNWSDGAVEGFLESDVVFTADPALTGGARARNVVIPIEMHGQVVGTYHTGFRESWLELQLAPRERAVRHRWLLVTSGFAAVVLLAGLALHRIHRRSAALQQAMSMAHVKQLSDLGRLVGALAHEIRNPLNAIRLNLHVLQNVLMGRAQLSEDEIQNAVEQSKREIERLTSLMKTMLGYARPDQAVVETVELNSEIESLSSFLAPIMERDAVELAVRVPEFGVVVSMDPDRLRQVLLNLVNNAREAAGEGGRIVLVLTASETEAEILVADSGPGVPVTEQDRVFEAFYSTRETGTGLGLALVKRCVEEAGGSVSCESADPGLPVQGAVFRVHLPLVSRSSAASAAPPSTASSAGVM